MECPLAAILEGLVQEEREYFEKSKTLGIRLKKRKEWVSKDLPTKALCSGAPTCRR